MPQLLKPEAVLWSARGFRKPQIPVLNFSHPINFGLTGLFVTGGNDATKLYDMTLTGGVLNVSGLNMAHSLGTTLNAGPVGGKVSFLDGNFLTCTNSNLYDYSLAVSCAVWFRANGINSNSRLVTKCPDSSTTNGWEIFQNSSDSGHIRFSVTKGGIRNSAASTTPLVSGMPWTFIGGSYDSVSGFGYCYINGLQQGSIITSTGGLTSSGSPLCIGALPAGNFGAPGGYELIRIWNRVVTPAEFWQLSQEPYAGIWDAAASRNIKGTFVPPPPVGAPFIDSTLWG